MKRFIFAAIALFLSTFSFANNRGIDDRINEAFTPRLADRLGMRARPVRLQIGGVLRSFTQFSRDIYSDDYFPACWWSFIFYDLFWVY